MKFKYIIINTILIFLFLIDKAYCQTYTISGVVKDANTGSFLTGANVYFQENLNGSATDINGNYSFQDKMGTYTLICSFIGYDTVREKVILNKNIKINFKLKASTVNVEGVEIKVEREDENIKSTDISTIELSMKRLEKIPVIFGEKDILKTIQLLPGIQAGGEGSNTFFVRGGGSDQNLILIDGATVYNPSHAAGFFSVFNSSVINSAEIIKGGMAPEYGGRMSSVLNISTLDGDKQQYKEKLGIGLLASNIQAEGPIIRDVASYSFAARRTYIDLIMHPFLSNSKEFSGLNYFFYDLNGKLSFNLSDKDNIFITGYYGKDVFKFNAKDQSYNIDMNWENAVGVIRWNHILNKKWYFDMSGSISDYLLNVAGSEQTFTLAYSSGIRNFTVKEDVTWIPDSTNKIKFGLSHSYYIFSPSSAKITSSSEYFNVNTPSKLYCRDLVAYIQHEWQITNWFKVLYGLRYTYFEQIGPFTRYKIDNVFDLTNIDSTYYGKGKQVSDYNIFEPRLNTRFQISKNKSIKASYTLTRQYLNLAALTDLSLPTDVWLPSSELIKPQLTHQYSVGYFQNFLNNTIETSVEVYYRRMRYLLELNPKTNIGNIFNTNLDYAFILGNGRSYGIEFFINKTTGKFTGWLGYTLSWTTRNFNRILDGNTFYAHNDRRHDISLMMNYEMNEKWSFSLVWVFASGNASTVPNAFTIVDNSIYIEYGKHNGWRMPDYHRLDLSANWKVLKRKHFTGDLNFSIYNAYNRHNPYIISYVVEKNKEGNKFNVKAYQISIFPILPSVAFNMQFK